MKLNTSTWAHVNVDTVRHTTLLFADSCYYRASVCIIRCAAKSGRNGTATSGAACQTMRTLSDCVGATWSDEDLDRRSLGASSRSSERSRLSWSTADRPPSCLQDEVRKKHIRCIRLFQWHTCVKTATLWVLFLVRICGFDPWIFWMASCVQTRVLCMYISTSEHRV